MSAATSAATSVHRPYRGPDSFRPEDAGLFFGRDREARQLVATILSAPFTLLHAPSGAGKSSLLNARIIPELEEHGWFVVRAVPNDDPAESLRVAAVDSLLPHPAAEAYAIWRAVRQLVGRGSDTTLAEVASRYGTLRNRDPRRRRLIQPVRPGRPPCVSGWGGTPVTPFFCRFLRGSISLDRLAEHLAALAHDLPADAAPFNGADAGASALELARLLSSPHWAAAWQSAVAQLSMPGLRPFFANLMQVWGVRHTEFTLVLILDQFEELFTRFVDPGPARAKQGDLPAWQIRPAFFKSLRELYVDAALPVRYVVSMREEFLARLEPLRSFVPERDLCMVGLGFLDRGDAAAAIGEPARYFGYQYEKPCFDDIIAKLTREDRFVEPTQLQIVCDKLWTVEGSRLSGEAAPAGEDLPPGADELREVSFDVYKGLGCAEGILERFFREYVETLNEKDRFETLDLLDPLITSGGTRNIVELDQLLEAPFRDRRRREELLEGLRRKLIVRVEPRMGGMFVEITHEFLIQPIVSLLAEVQGGDERTNRFRFALRTLNRFEDDLRPDGLLSPDEFAVLHRNRERIVWPAWALDLMLRSAVARGRPAAEVAEWARLYAGEVPSPERELLWAELAAPVPRSRPLSLEECRTLGDPPAGAALQLSTIEMILESLLVHGRRAERGHIQSWTQRLVSHAS